MSRWEETEKVASPVLHYIDVKSTKKQFSYWDKEAQERKEFTFSKPFTILKVGISVGGIGLFSNEIENAGKEILYVRRSQGGLVTKGLWNDIKQDVENEGGKFQKSITISYDGKILALTLQGETMFAFGKVLEGLIKHKNKVEFTGEWEEKKSKGKVYYIPVFSKSEAINPDEFTLLKEQAKKVEEYFASRTMQSAEEAQVEVAEKEKDEELMFSDEEDNPDLPF